VPEPSVDVDREFVVRLCLGALTVACLALAACRDEDPPPPCAEQLWVETLVRGKLIASPVFSASEVRAGDPLFLIAEIDIEVPGFDAGVARTGGRPSVLRAEETPVPAGRVELPVNTVLAPGVYYLAFVSSEGSGFVTYRAADAGELYVLTVVVGAEAGRSCLTEFVAPSFTVVE
jgi:hypothetical protein